jgi:hypothetical protein
VELIKKDRRWGRGIKIMLFRMWAAGAVCFFGAWGRSAPTEAGNVFSYSLIISLIAVMILADILLVNPVLRLSQGKRLIPEYKNPLAFFYKPLIHGIFVIMLMFFVIGTYYLLNTLFIRIGELDEMSVPVLLEPILFGILYGLYYTVCEYAGNVIYSAASQLKHRIKE